MDCSHAVAPRPIQKSEARSKYPRAPIPPTHRIFPNRRPSPTGNEIPAPKSLSEICNEPISSTKSYGINKPLLLLNKAPPALAECLFIIIKDLCTVTRPGLITTDEFFKSNTSRKHTHNFGYLDHLEILKLIPKDWQNKIKTKYRPHWVPLR